MSRYQFQPEPRDAQEQDREQNDSPQPAEHQRGVERASDEQEPPAAEAELRRRLRMIHGPAQLVEVLEQGADRRDGDHDAGDHHPRQRLVAQPYHAADRVPELRDLIRRDQARPNEPGQEVRGDPIREALGEDQDWNGDQATDVHAEML